jgi:hypothetical protein
MKWLLQVLGSLITIVCGGCSEGRWDVPEMERRAVSAINEDRTHLPAGVTATKAELVADPSTPNLLRGYALTSDGGRLDVTVGIDSDTSKAMIAWSSPTPAP